MSALDMQVGGMHYKERAIQPIEYIHANDLNFSEGSIVKYITRWRDKGGIADLQKIKHYVDLLIEMERKYGTLKDNDRRVDKGAGVIAKCVPESSPTDSSANCGRDLQSTESSGRGWGTIGGDCQGAAQTGARIAGRGEKGVG